MKSNIRIGQGYDVHKLVEDRRLILGGVDIPYEKGLLGHSDADVLVHAALGDIGRHFPDNSDDFKNISSLILLDKVFHLLKDKGYTTINIDATVIAQRPKLASHIEDMRKNIANALQCDVDQINIKATTEEGLGFTGTGEGIAAQAVCLIEKI